MIARTTDPFDALFRLQRELEGRLASDWLADTTSGYPATPDPRPRTIALIAAGNGNTLTPEFRAQLVAAFAASGNVTEIAIGLPATSAIRQSSGSMTCRKPSATGRK